MNSENVYSSLKNYAELIRQLIIANVNGESLFISAIKKNKKYINKIPFIIKNFSCYCINCGEYNEGFNIKICHSCGRKLKDNIKIKYRINIYPSLPEYLAKYNKKKIKIIFEECSLKDIKNENLIDEDSKIIIHISPFFKFTKKFEIHKYNLNHIFLNWKDSSELFNKNKIKKLIQEVTDYVFEEKNNVIIWKKIDDTLFPKLIRDLLLLEGHKNVKLGGVGPDQGKDILSKFKKNKWLTQCKFYLKGSVSSKEIATIDWLATHKCNCYRLAALKVSGTLVTKLKNLDNNRKFGIKVADFWDEDEIRDLLVRNDNLRIKYFEE